MRFSIRRNTDQTLPASHTIEITFNLPADRPAPEIVGAPDAIARARVMTQPDSPLAIVRLDLSGINLVAGPGSFERTGRHAVDVRNVSNQVLTDAEVMVHVVIGETGGGSGVGSGRKTGRPLRSGEQIRIEWTPGTGRGSNATTDEVSIVAVVRQVRMAGCSYVPSQAWPVSQTDR